jgi:hypothetical protein
MFTVLVVLALGAPLSPTHDLVIASETLATPIPASSAFACDVDCSEQSCLDGEHDAWDTTPAFYRWTRNGGAHSGGQCFEGTCDTKHGPECQLEGEGNVTNAEMEDLRRSILSSNKERVAAFLAAHPRRAHLNLDRAALQLLNCNGSVTLHMPIPGPLLQTLATTPSAALRP